MPSSVGSKSYMSIIYAVTYVIISGGYYTMLLDRAFAEYFLTLNHKILWFFFSYAIWFALSSAFFFISPVAYCFTAKRILLSAATTGFLGLLIIILRLNFKVK